MYLSVKGLGIVWLSDELISNLTMNKLSVFARTVELERRNHIGLSFFRGYHMLV